MIEMNLDSDLTKLKQRGLKKLKTPRQLTNRQLPHPSQDNIAHVEGDLQSMIEDSFHKGIIGLIECDNNRDFSQEVHNVKS